MFCWFLLTHFHQGAADFSWAIRAAKYLLAGKNPYDTPLEQYPMTAALFGLPFVWMRPEVAAPKIVNGIVKNKQEVRVGGAEIYAILLKRFVPGLVARILKVRK